MHSLQQGGDTDASPGMAENERANVISKSPTKDSSKVGKSILLEKIYHGRSEGAFRGPKAIYTEAQKLGHRDISLQDCKDFLRTQPTYGLYRPARRNYRRNPIITHYCGEVVQLDIMDMQRHKAENDGYLYALLSYDTYSKYLSYFPIKDRKPPSILAGLRDLVYNLPFSIANIYWDKEGSFLSRKVQKWLKDNDIGNYTTNSQVKAPSVERVIRTIRTATARYFKMTKTQRWVDFLPQFVSNYNNRDHSTTKHKPIDMANDPMLLVPVRKQVKRKGIARIPPIGSYVRLNKLRGVFEKESRGTWSVEIFRVVAHKLRQSLPMVRLEDLTGEAILGSFYLEEVLSVEWEATKEVKEVFKTRMRRGAKEYLVSYVGWPSKFLEWTRNVPEAFLKPLSNV